jgi:hypothetical protein
LTVEAVRIAGKPLIPVAGISALTVIDDDKRDGVPVADSLAAANAQRCPVTHAYTMLADTHDDMATSQEAVSDRLEAIRQTAWPAGE